MDNRGTTLTCDSGSVTVHTTEGIFPHQANISEENRKQFVTSVAVATRGLDIAKNPDRLYNQLITEAANSTPGRPFEFLPVKMRYWATDDNRVFLCNEHDIPIRINAHDNLEYSFVDFNNKIGRYSYIDGNVVYTNMRTLLKAGIPYEFIPYNKDIAEQDFQVLRIKSPMFTWAQLMTHTRLSKVSYSDRVGKKDKEYWLPKDLKDRIQKYLNNREEIDFRDPLQILARETMRIPAMRDIVSFYIQGDSGYQDIETGDFIGFYPTQQMLTDFFKVLGYNQEIYNRVMYYMQYKTAIFGGWTVDPDTWNNLLKERQGYPENHTEYVKTWAQEQVKDIASLVYKLNFSMIVSEE